MPEKESVIEVKPPMAMRQGGVIFRAYPTEEEESSINHIEVLKYIHGDLTVQVQDEYKLSEHMTQNPSKWGFREGGPMLECFSPCELKWNRIGHVDNFLSMLEALGLDKRQQFKKAIIEYQKEYEPPDMKDLGQILR